MMKDFTEFDDLVRSFILLQGGCTADDSPSVSIGKERFNDLGFLEPPTPVGQRLCGFNSGQS